MATTVSSTTGVVEAFATVDSFSSKQKARTKEHEILDGDVVFTMRDAGPRRSTLELLFADAEDAETCRVAFATGQIVTLSDPDNPTLISPVTLTGDLESGLDKKTARVWIVKADVTEVPA